MVRAIQISKLNDFIFCPYSLYLHAIFESFDKSLYQDTPQLLGTIAHEAVDTKKYSSRKNILKSTAIYSETYNLIGKIDIFDKSTGLLVERKRKVKKIYAGYILQLHAQYVCLTEMGYKVKSMCIHSLIDNKRYPIPLPTAYEQVSLRLLTKSILQYNPSQLTKPVSANKCSNCIYITLCDKATCYS